MSLIKRRGETKTLGYPVCRPTIDRRTTKALAVALENAIERGDLDTCKALFRQGCSLDGKVSTCHSCTPLLLAVQLAKYDIVSWLLENKSSVFPVTYHNHVKSTAFDVGICFLDFAVALSNTTEFLPFMVRHHPGPRL